MDIPLDEIRQIPEPKRGSIKSGSVSSRPAAGSAEDAAERFAAEPTESPAAGLPASTRIICSSKGVYMTTVPEGPSTCQAAAHVGEREAVVWDAEELMC